ncbi:trypsin epsilon [Scaptodrosophila lebanonensis]|uniref:trypsin n=1 Tax=Drosophila lebanonensis TaxID=7225 RepID=A0A6J2TTP1_DROLE|nr:trypsin epsilon [Scaptodrosophila lebanonensis]
MFLSKFLVYIVFVFELYLIDAQMVNRQAQHPLNGSGVAQREDNNTHLNFFSSTSTTSRTYYTATQVGKNTTYLDNLRSNRAARAKHTTKRKKPTIKPRTDYEDDEFHFLVTGGYRPTVNQLVKYVVSIRTAKERKFFGDNHFCGGAIISTKAILTAAHCLYVGATKLRPSKIKIVSGTPRRLVRTAHTQVAVVDKVRPHPKYSARRLTNDIGIIKLKDELKIEKKFTEIISLADSPPEAGLQCTVCGWGTVIQFGPTPDEAVNGDMAINPTSYCKRLEGFTKGMICASDSNDHEVDSCQGDSGGPLICNDKVVGIVSYGFGCGEPDSAGVYTDVYHFREWIAENAATADSREYKSILFHLPLILPLAIYVF